MTFDQWMWANVNPLHDPGEMNAPTALLKAAFDAGAAAGRERSAMVLDQAQHAAGKNNDLRAYELLGGLAAAMRRLPQQEQP